MKTLSNGFEVPSRTYYYLLDWNEANDWKYIREHFNKEKLKDLTREEYNQLFLFVSRSELINL